MLNGIMTAISVLMILGGAYIVAEAFMSDSTFMRTHKRTDELWVSACNGIARCLGVKPNQPSLSAYERDCKKYADTLPAFSEQTKRIMQREGVLPRQSPQVHRNETHDKPEWPERAEPVREVKISEAAKRKIRRDFPLASDYAPRIVREVVEVEEIEITSKSSAEVTVEGFERRYYEPIEEPDISRILLDD